MAKRSQAEEARLQEALKKIEKAIADNAALDAKKAEIERTLQATKDEEKALRAGMPGLNVEMAAAQTALQALLSQRSSAESHALKCQADAASATKQWEDAKSQAATLVASNAKLSAQLQDLQQKIAQKEAALKTAESESAAAQKGVAALQEREAQATKRVDELARRVESLQKEDETLSSTLSQKKEQIQAGESSLEGLQKKLAATETRYAEFMTLGGQAQTLSEALAKLEIRHRDTTKAVSEVAEQELTHQVKLTGLHESIKKESERLDQVRTLREREEAERHQALEKAQRDFDAAREKLTADFAKDEAALTNRVKGRVEELEEKHDYLRKSLTGKTDEDTVVMFAHDLIKRIDLIDILIQKYSGPNGVGGVDQQLSTLRSSFEDILAQHGIHEFSVAPGTEVDVELRQRIAIVENEPGKAKPRVTASFRPGFIYGTEDGREVILRKVEVKTSSQ